jgi:hypothetical protein
MGNKLSVCSLYCKEDNVENQIDRVNEVNLSEREINKSTNTTISLGSYNYNPDLKKSNFKLNLGKLMLNSKGITNISTARTSSLSERGKFTFNPNSSDKFSVNKGK